MVNQKNNQIGAVSIFVVIFAALLVLLVVTAFIRIMLQDQQQATANDLSRSALDSANAGVEDTKRAIVQYYKSGCHLPTTPDSAECTQLKTALGVEGLITDDGWTKDCAAVPTLLGITKVPNMGFLLKEGSDNDLDQAYTCIKVQMAPPNYIGSLTPNTSRVIKLQAKEGDPKKIKIDWYAMKDGQSLDVDPGTAAAYKLPRQWPQDRPPVIRAQLLQFRKEFALSDFDQDMSYNTTLFMLPSALGVSNTAFSYADHPRAGSQLGFALPIHCAVPAIGADRYACSVTIDLPDVNAGEPTDRTAYLKIGQFYSAANTQFRVSMLDASSTPLHFKDVQPVVDSTGRASNLFRRVQSRIDIGTSNVPNPESAVDVSKSLCKIFTVTDSTVEADTARMNGTICPSLP
ncbi:MAG: hypothetical protein QG549_456 [Patescibacteria group bacterium]|nr:hypothetical protein [Patescibacteria group bacterium]